MEDVAEQEARAEQNDARFEPELVGGDAGREDARNADGVGNDEADDDGPEHEFNVGERSVMGLSVGVDRQLDEFACVSHGGEKQQAGDESDGALRKGSGAGL